MKLLDCKSQEYILKYFEDQNRKMPEITKNKQLENDNALLNTRIINLEKLSTEQEKQIQLNQYGRQEMVEIRGIPMEQGNNCIRITEQICALAGMTNDNIEEIAQNKKSQTCEEGGRHLRISFWHLLMNLKKKYLLKKLLKRAKGHFSVILHPHPKNQN